jgi:two-component system, sensor histidine kinase PdtaS
VNALPPEIAVDPATTRNGPVPAGQRFKWPPRTGTLLFVILGLALAPIGFIGVRAAMTQLERSDSERTALIGASTREQAANLASRLRSDRTLLIETVRRRGNVPTGDRCRTILGLFPGIRGEAPSTQVVDAVTGAHRCIDGVPPDRDAIGRRINTMRLNMTAGTLTHTVLDLGDGSRAEIVYPVPVIIQISGDSRAIQLERRFLDGANATLPLTMAGADDGWSGFNLTSRAPVGRTGLTLRAATNRTLFDSADAFLTLATPVGMWLLALLLSWLVVDSLLLGPVGHLGRRLQGYAPGDDLPPPRYSWFRVAEVSALDNMMQGLIDRVTTDKQSLAQSLQHQQSLTLEVHHRVKNNLQIISSLINLHSRDSANDNAIGAYRIMQRRVDALAVVYRHLQAEGELRVGVAANTLLTDLSNGLRQSIDADAGGGALHIDTVPAHVTQDVALPMAFFVTELVELAFAQKPGGTVMIALSIDPTSARLARLSITSDALRGAKLFEGNRASYHRVLQGLARQLRCPLEIDERGGRYAITVPTL